MANINWVCWVFPLLKDNSLRISEFGTFLRIEVLTTLCFHLFFQGCMYSKTTLKNKSKIFLRCTGQVSCHPPTPQLPMQASTAPVGRWLVQNGSPIDMTLLDGNKRSGASIMFGLRGMPCKILSSSSENVAGQLVIFVILKYSNSQMLHSFIESPFSHNTDLWLLIFPFLSTCSFNKTLYLLLQEKLLDENSFTLWHQAHKPVFTCTTQSFSFEMKNYPSHCVQLNL